MLETLSNNIGKAVTFAFAIAGKYPNLFFTFFIFIGRNCYYQLHQAKSLFAQI